MKNLPIALKDALESQELIQALLVNMTVGGHEFKFTSWSSPVLYNSSLFYPRGLDLSNISFSATNIVDSVRIDFDDVDRGLYSAFGDQDAGNFPITLTLVILNSTWKVVTNLDVFRGTIDQWDYKPGKLSLVAASIFAQWAQVTTSKFSGSCRWKVFRGLECKYAGTGTECDRTYDQCKTYGNIENFGGFRWLPSLAARRLKED